jgi:predicted metal-dependent hydrolase
LKHHNHSKAFWNAVAEIDPQCQEHRKSLKRYHF